MFSISTSGTTCTVTRTLELPKSGKLPAQTIESSFEAKLDLAGTDPKGPVGKEVIKLFQNVLMADLRIYATKAAKDAEDAWKTLGKALEKVADKAAATDLVETLEQDVASEWNSFARTKGKTFVERSFDYAVKDVSKTHDAALAKARVGFGASELKPARLGILGSILAAITITPAGGVLGGMAFALAGMATLIKGYTGAWEIARARAADVQANLNQIDDALDRIDKAMTSLAPRVKAMTAARDAIEAELLASTRDLAKLRDTLADLEKRAKSEKAVREGKYLSDVQDRVAAMDAGIAGLRKQLGALDALTAAIRDAGASVAKARGLSTADRKGWDALMARFTKVSSDTQSGVSAVVSLIKAIKAAV